MSLDKPQTVTGPITSCENRGSRDPEQAPGPNDCASALRTPNRLSVPRTRGTASPCERLQDGE
jgi:hypothetical protein